MRSRFLVTDGEEFRIVDQDEVEAAFDDMLKTRPATEIYMLTRVKTMVNHLGQRVPGTWRFRAVNFAMPSLYPKKA